MDKQDLPIYLDYAATTPCDPRVVEAMLPYFTEHFGNPSSQHIYGKIAKRAVDEALEQIAALINAQPEELIITSGATEAINLAIKGTFEANRHKGNHIITVKTEHKAVLATCEYLEEKGAEVTYLSVDENGLINLQELKDAINDQTILICVMYVNNETGVIQDIPAIGEIAREHGVTFFCDATQAVGKIALDVVKDKVDMLCMSAHKMYGPKGVGALWKGRGLKIAPLIHGGGQQNNFRSGTLASTMIIGLGCASAILNEEYHDRSRNLIRKQEETELFFTSTGLGIVNCSKAQRSPTISSISLTNQSARQFLIEREKEFIASTGSACTNSIIQDSHVANALGLPQDRVLRLSYYG
jgi:cysteine desulfurase